MLNLLSLLQLVMVQGILDYQICGNKPAEKIHIAKLYVAW